MSETGSAIKDLPNAGAFFAESVFALRHCCSCEEIRQSIAIALLTPRPSPRRQATTGVNARADQILPRHSISSLKVHEMDGLTRRTAARC
jgi:hypothetical protein